ncbi:hypothetical protein GCM10010317_054080 [Streptomyces mirabilis]|nr:hypothetical protein GCM10010317_054080 [Streptomyces mirabilis]
MPIDPVRDSNTTSSQSPDGSAAAPEGVLCRDLADVRLWVGELDALHERFVHRFNREEPRQSALAHMRGLVAPLERKERLDVGTSETARRS